MKLVITATIARAGFAPILLQGPLEEDFKKASEFGYDMIELHLRDPYEIDWDKTVELSDNYSLPISAIGTGAAARVDGLTFTNPDNNIRNKSIDRFKEHLKLAKLLDCAIILGSMNGNIDGDEQRKEYHLDCMKQCCDLAAKEDITVLIEPLNRYESDWLNSADHAIEIIKTVGYPHLKYLADTFQMNIEEANICQSLKKAGDSLGYLHLVDSNRKVPGHGHIRFDEIITTLREISYDGVLSFECLAKPTSDKASEEAINYAKELLLEKRNCLSTKTRQK